MNDRNLKYLNDNRILYRRDPINDMPQNNTTGAITMNQERLNVMLYFVVKPR